MFKVTEDIRHGDYRRVSIGVGGNVRSALMSVLKHSPYNSNLDQGKKDALSSVLADKKSAEYGWATYICEYRGNLTECIIVHGDDMQHAVVVFDNGDTLQVIDLEEGQAPPEPESWPGMPVRTIKTTAVKSFDAPPTDEEAEQMISSLER